MRKKIKINTPKLIKDLEDRKEKKISMAEIAKKHKISRARIYQYIIDNDRQDLLSKAGRISNIEFN